jgi:hypothetical protein
MVNVLNNNGEVDNFKKKSLRSYDSNPQRHCLFENEIFFQPDYYDALDYESKRQKTPKSERKKGQGYPLRSPSAASSAGTKMRWEMNF